MSNRKGFTVIEALIVLAIAGLILTIVFLAVPAVQRSGRNDTRRSDVSLLMAALRDQQSQSSTGALPDTCDNTQEGCFLRDTQLAYYDNQSSVRNLAYWRNTSAFGGTDQLTTDDDDATNWVLIHTYARCDGTMLTGQGAGRQTIAVQYAIETAGGPAVQCEEL